MSLIVHRCIPCGHPDIFHRNGECSYAQCHVGPRGRHEPQWGSPEVLPTWRNGDGAPVDELVEPGSTFRGFGQVPVELCGCDSCAAIYAGSGPGLADSAP